MDRRERAGASEHRYLRGIAAIGLNAITGAAGDQPGRDDLTGDPAAAQVPVQREAAGAGFITTADRAAAADLVPEASPVGQLR